MREVIGLGGGAGDEEGVYIERRTLKNTNGIRRITATAVVIPLTNPVNLRHFGQNTKTSYPLRSKRATYYCVARVITLPSWGGKGRRPGPVGDRLDRWASAIDVSLCLAIDPVLDTFGSFTEEKHVRGTDF